MSNDNSGATQPVRFIAGMRGALTELSAQVKQTVIGGILEETGNRSTEELKCERDIVLMGFLGHRLER
jgi:hypothetical protein